MRRVLIIDDEVGFAGAVSRRLAALGYDPAVATRLDAGVREARALSPDVVLLDLHLPDGDGTSVIDQLSAAPSRPEVIILTGDGSPTYVDRALQAGVWAYVIKGGSFKEIEDALTGAFQYREGKSSEAPPSLVLDGVIGSSAVMQVCLQHLAHAAASDASVLLTGEAIKRGGVDKVLPLGAIAAEVLRQGRS